VVIDQVDITVSEVEEWRFCPECNHAQRIDIGDEASACPACSSAGWRDDGQRFRLLKLEQVFANAPDRESRIKDDKDDRQPRFFQRQVLVDIADQDRVGAWRVDDDAMPFGFELLRRATFREVNFGEPSDQGAKSMIAGRSAARPGFEVCARCGKVQKANGEPEHVLSCPSRKEGSRQQIESCLYLYREFASEALRLLLPMTDLGTTKQLSSFVAALQVGMKMFFHGSVDHLHTTVYSDPVEGSTLRKQYLVLFDTVPGGTGYLKQLVTPREEGGQMPLFEVLELALQRIEECPCWSDPERDGCYSCLYAYRIAREMSDTSAQVASDLLRRILARRNQLVAIESLGQISISGLLDSELELRFLEALRTITRDGREAQLKPAVVNQKPGYRWSLGEAEWMIEPQVKPPPAESAGVPVSVDFVMRPARARSERRLAIFLDGWTFHKRRIGKDLRQRMALLAGGGWDVWTFTWVDLDLKLGVSSSQEVPELAVPDHLRLKEMLKRMDQAVPDDLKRSEMALARHAELLEKTVFDWFEAELLGDGLPWQGLAKAALAARMQPAQADAARHWAELVGRVAPPVVQPRLASMTPRLSARDNAENNPYFELMAVHDGTDPALLCTIDDREENLEATDLKAAWHGYLRLFQLLCRAPNAWFMSHSGTLEGEAYAGIAAVLAGTPDDITWSNAGDIEPEYQELARTLMAAGVPEPEVGMEIPDSRGDTWAEAELVWEAARVAVTARATTEDAKGSPAAGWVVIFLEDLSVGDDPTPVIEALQQSEEGS
jgi:DEAD/DEAH box helicase domain-containing protein